MSAVDITNYLLRANANFSRNILNGNCWLELYQNTPALIGDMFVNDFVRCNFPGYSPLLMSGLWNSVVKQVDGIFLFELPDVVFIPTGDDGQLVNGWFMNLGGIVVACARFENPFHVFTGEPIEFSVQIETVLLS